MEAIEKKETSGVDLLSDYLSYFDQIEPVVSEETEELEETEDLSEEEVLDATSLLLAQSIMTHGPDFHIEVESDKLLESLGELDELDQEELVELVEMIKSDLQEGLPAKIKPPNWIKGSKIKGAISKAREIAGKVKSAGAGAAGKVKSAGAGAASKVKGASTRTKAIAGAAAAAGGIGAAALARRRARKKAANESFDATEFLAGMELSEDYKAQLTETLGTKVNSILEESEIQLTEEFENYFQEEILPAIEKEKEAEVEAEVEKSKEELVDKVDSYMTYLAEQWMEDNEIAVESSIRTSIGESFMEGMKQLFVEHYVDIPDDKVDIVEELANKVLTLEEQLESHINENVELKQQLEEGETAIQESEEESKREEILTYISEDLSLAQKEKFKKLSSSIKYLNEEQFYARAEQLKEEHFVEETEGVDYEADEPIEDTQNITPLMDSYSSAISRSQRYQQ